MSYQALIDSNLVRAFNLIKDLAVDVVLIKKPNPAFDFGTGTASFSASQSITTKAVVIDIKKKAEDRNTIEKQLMLKAKDVGDITRYATVQIDSQTWTVGDIPKNDGFIFLVNIYREA
jgi:hypothetical protein